MKKGTSFFQIGVFIACGIGIAFAVLIFSDKLPIGKKTATQITGTVTIWGTLPSLSMRKATEVVGKSYKNVSIVYTQKDPKTIQNDLVNALASGVGPDAVFITPADVVQNHDRFFTIPYLSLPQATFQSMFVDQSNAFLTDVGVIALPFVVDPMVMYYNRDMLTSSFTVNPPATWDDVIALNKKITQKSDAGSLTTETIALGTFSNINHAKDILVNLMFQAGNGIVAWDYTQKAYVSTFGKNTTNGTSGVIGALRFFTNFSNPNDADRYSWNATLPDDKSQFISGKLAIYLGYASELLGIRQKNPNLNFDIAMMPQRTGTTTKTTYGHMVGLSIMKSSKNPVLALTIAQTLVSKDAMTAYLNEDPTFTAARKDLLVNQSDNARQTLINNSAIISRSFLDPDTAQTDAIFKQYIDGINAGQLSADAILTPVDSLITGLLAKLQK